MVSLRTTKFIFFIIGALLLLVGAILGGLWGIIYDRILKSELTLTKTSMSYKIWKDIPIPIYMEFYLFNWTNVNDVLKNGSVKPYFVEMGPYVFREYHHRVNIRWNANETVTYRQVRSWHFKPEMSNGSLDDEITNINMIAATVAFQTRFLNLPELLGVDMLMRFTKTKITVTKTVRELLFEGYNDTLLNIVKNISHVPFDRFGYFVGRNNSASADGTFNMLTGASDLKQLGMMKQWNFQNHTGLFGRPCDEVRGSSGDLWPPVVGLKSAQIFSSDLCFSLPLVANGSVESHGLTGSIFMGNNRTLDNGSHFPEAKCQCVGECQPFGTLNASSCRFGSPLFVSFPHFYLADPLYRDSCEGLNPNAENHTFFLVLQPETGMPLHVEAKLQLNVMVKKWKHLSVFKDLLPNKSLFVPTLWFVQRADLPPTMASQARTLLLLPTLGRGILFGLAGLGAFIILLGILLSFRHQWDERSEDDTDRLLPGESPEHLRNDHTEH